MPRYRIIVRAKRDADAIKSMINTFFSGWDIDVKSFKGVRTKEEAKSKISEVISPLKYNVILLGRENCDLLLLEDEYPLNVVFHMLDKKKVRNARTYTLAKEFERARAVFRNSVCWMNNAYVFSHKGTPFLKEAVPAYDIFLGIGNELKEFLTEILGFSCECPLFLRKFGGQHEVYCGPEQVGVLHVPDVGRLSALRISEPSFKGPSIEDLIAANQHVVRVHERISLEFLRLFDGKFEEIVVPWSGGKDSTAVLLLALKVFGKERVTAVYVDTGVDFPHSREYVRKISEELGVNLVETYAPVKEELSKRGFPTHDNRWCTQIKVTALHEEIRRRFKGKQVLLVVGDRDAESRSRSQRPPVRRENSWTVVAPIRAWSTALVQVYLLSEGIPLNKLYEYGFYRLGCYVCPALRSWEIEILKREPLRSQLEDLPFFKEFLKFREELSK